MSLKAKVSSHITGTGLFWPLISFIVLVAIFYIYSVNKTVMLVAQRNTIESRISTDRASITTLEASYITSMDNITLDLAHSLGYEVATNIVYIPQKSVSALARSETLQ